jgi:membrane protease YdiL (CAAX protease family)
LIAYGALFGVLMVAAAWLWAVVLRDRSLTGWFPSERRAIDLALGSAIGLVAAVGAWPLVDRITALRQIRTLLNDMLDMDSFRWYHAPLIGLVAGIPEEILFRGAIQPELGWILTAILFGAVHAVTRAYFVYATLAGALLGGLTLWRGGLWAPIAAHTVIDAVMFGLLLWHWRHRATSPHSTAR